MELEYEGSVPQKVVRFHLQCQSVWDEARQLRSSPWTPVAEELPPLLHIVEARIGLHEQRSVILTVMRINHGDDRPARLAERDNQQPLARELAADRMARPSPTVSSNRRRKCLLR